MPASSNAASAGFRQFERLSFIARRPVRGGTGGEHVSRRRAPSTDFVDYRRYQPGDDFRRIDWNVYGRLGTLQVKVTEGRERLEVVLVLDCSSSMAFGTPDKLKFGAQLVAALAYVGTARADSVRIACLGLPTGGRLGPLGRRSRLPDVVRQLSELTPVGVVDLNGGLAELLSEDPSRHQLIVLISDLLTPDGVARGLDALAARSADTVVLHVVSPEELDPHVSGEVELVDAESGGVLELGVSVNTLAAYRARFEAWLDDRANEARSRGLRYVRLHTHQALANVVMDDLRRGGVLR